MKELIKEMRVVVDGEVVRAMDRYGKGYASDHEGYGVLSEEIWEAEKEVRDVRKAQNLLLQAIHAGDEVALQNMLELLQESAIHAACECAQIAAVASKMRGSDKPLTARIRAYEPFGAPPRDLDGPLGGL
jgi:hypothetical protein